MLNNALLAKVISNYDPNKLEETVVQLKLALKMYNAVGVAANQIGIDQRVAIIKNRNNIVILKNPMIYEVSPLRRFVLEGCISLPGYWAKIKRPEYLYVQEIGTEADDKYYEGEIAARVKHEIDHLDGITILDRVAAGEGFRVNA